jgi:putative PIN family toxin of toxin-antitoxin system
LILAVVDTNILVRALIKPEGTVGPILGRLRDGDYRIAFSEPLLAELVDVLNRPHIRGKYGLDQGDIETVLALLLLRGESFSPTERIERCRDPKDNMILEVAITAGVDVIVSGDEDLLVLNPYEQIPIVEPNEFMRMLDAETEL